MYKLFFAFIATVLLSACATGQVVHNDINQGMTRQQVVEVLGRPDGVQTAGQYEAFEYANRLISGWSWDRADYYVVLQNGVVTSYGPGQVRQERPGVLVLVPVH